MCCCARRPVEYWPRLCIICPYKAYMLVHGLEAVIRGLERGNSTARERVADPGDVWWTLVDSWGRPPERRCRGGERCGCAAAGWLLGWLPADRTLTFLALRRIDSQSEAGNGIATSQNRLLTRMHELISLIFCRTSPRQNRFPAGIATAKKLQHAIPSRRPRKWVPPTGNRLL